jgi:hypothetical protein
MGECKNVIWMTPSSDPSGSMPLGNGDIGWNVWVEKGRRPAVLHRQDGCLG